MGTPIEKATRVYLYGVARLILGIFLFCSQPFDLRHPDGVTAREHGKIKNFFLYMHQDDDMARFPFFSLLIFYTPVHVASAYCNLFVPLSSCMGLCMRGGLFASCMPR
jgi:hypothetical protein